MTITYSEKQKETAENIVTIHETGKLNSKSYGIVTNVRGDPGGFTYGKHQLTINSGNLYLMLKRYCSTPGAIYAAPLVNWLEPFRQKSQSVVAAAPSLRDILLKAGNDPVMQRVQDQYFDEQYWTPAVKFCNAHNLDKALALAIVYDSTIQGSLYRIQKMIPQNLSTEQWCHAYVEARRNWFVNNKIAILRRCTYRMDTFSKLIDAHNFDLNSPVYAHGLRADGDLAGMVPSVTGHGEAYNVSSVPVPPPTTISTQPTLSLKDRGDAVVELQNMLIRIGYTGVGKADGVFGNNTDTAVRAFQKLYGLTADGIVGPTTWRVLDQVDD